jgi:isoleucyl-tRNA synthetase
MSGYKNTINLPKTDFPMKAGLPVREPAMLERWHATGLYERIQQRRKDAPAYILHDGPPFANGDVHMGTALNKILKDFVVKSKTMAGFRAPFIPGWDCHGLPIEFRVVKSSAGLAPAEVRRRSEEYARKFIDTQRRQFKRLGVLGDWDQPYLTLDPAYEAAMIRAFAKFVEKGFVYRKKKPVLWSTGAHTALAEAEVEYAERTDPAIHVAFQAAGGPMGDASFVIWTTTPWTLPANLAIAVHPQEKYTLREVTLADGSTRRLVVANALWEAFLAETGSTAAPGGREFTGAELAGSTARHPFLEREVPVITADFVTMEKGTGQVHIAPGHGADDYLAGQAHGLDVLSPVDDLGKFTAECGVPALVGLHVLEHGNKEVLGILASRSALLGRSDYRHDYPHCWRSKTPILFRAVEQFFIRIDGLRETALAEIDATQWIPHWGRNRIRGTVESRPDWCISRQRTWGVPLPVFYDADGEPILDPAVINKVAEVFSDKGTNSWFELDDAAWAALVGLPSGTTRRNDTLDVWIDSGLSHETVLRTRPELAFPADLYLEATDQHRGWFQSSLMTSVALNDKAPYRTVLTHGFVMDVDTRKKISKSAAGGYQKPTDADHYVSKYGADLLRLWVGSVNFTDDVPFSEEIFKRLADSYRRIRNTLRILLANLHDAPAEDVAPPPTFVDRWILARLQDVVATCLDAYEKLEFHRVHHTLNQFCAVDLSSLYVDITKDRLYCDRPDSPRRRATQHAMRVVLDALTRLLAPILAFTAEETWDHFKPGSSVHLEDFPAPDASLADPAVAETMEALLRIRGRIAQAVEREQKAGILSTPLEASVRLFATPDERALLEPLAEDLEELLIIGRLEIVPSDEPGVEVSKTPDAKCERCWRHKPGVGSVEAHPTLCGRCADAVDHLP